MDILKLIGRQKELFTKDIEIYQKELSKIIGGLRFLVLGGAVSINGLVQQA
ncbi:MAG: hypothetical protein JEZ09_02050 [Salinivirgaceae bacterium]|nr:hypothetical protein [Salinivirgaceae bacterium]